MRLSSAFGLLCVLYTAIYLSANTTVDFGEDPDTGEEMKPETLRVDLELTQALALFNSGMLPSDYCGSTFPHIIHILPLYDRINCGFRSHEQKYGVQDVIPIFKHVTLRAHACARLLLVVVHGNIIH